MALTGNWLQPVGVLMIALAVARLAPIVFVLHRLRRLLLIYGVVASACLIAIIMTATSEHNDEILASVAKILCGATIGQLLAAAREYFKTPAGGGETK
jgi:hypothetical protein